MAELSDVDRGRAIIERWRVLAEKRLDYLIGLLETGRWQRFHTKTDFLENLEEAKIAVETWRMLASREATIDNRPVDLSWLGRDAVPLVQRDVVKRLPVTASPPVAAASAATDPGWRPPLAPAAMRERYPLLRNAL